MANLTTAVQKAAKTVFSCPINFTVANTVTIPVGVYTMLPGTSGDTTNRGLLDNYINESTAIFTGYCISSSTPGDLSITNTIVGNTAPAAGANSPGASVETGPHIWIQQSIAGGSAQSDVGKKVWLLNNNDLTLTSQLSLGLSNMVGRVVYFWSATSEDVLMYGMIGFDLLTS